LTDVPPKKKYLLLNWILFSSYGSLILFAFYSSIYCWPTQGSVIWFLLIIFCPPFLYHSVFLGYALIFDRLLHWKKSYRLLTLIIGLLLAGALLQISQSLSFSRFKTAYSPFIAQIQQKMPQPCDRNYFAIPQVQQYNASVTQKILKNNRPAGALFYNAQRFVLYFRAGAVDVTGSTLFYDSSYHQWFFFHQTNNQAADNLAARLYKLRQCSTF
jgi:hypothetical protein